MCHRIDILSVGNPTKNLEENLNPKARVLSHLKTCFGVNGHSCRQFLLAAGANAIGTGVHENKY